MRPLAIAVLLAGSSGCLAVPKPVATPHGSPPPETGRRTCTELAESARAGRDTAIGLGVAAFVVGAGGAITAAAMGPDRAVDAWWIARNRNVVTLTGATLFLAAGAALVVRAVELGTLASEAQGLAAAAGAGTQGVDDAEAYRGCLELGGGARRSGPREVAELRTALDRARGEREGRADVADARRVEAELGAKQTLVGLLEERVGRLGLERELLLRAIEAATKPEPPEPQPPPKPGKPAPPPPPPPAPRPAPADKARELARVTSELDLATKQLTAARAELEAARRAFGASKPPSRFDVPSAPRAPGRHVSDDLGY